MNRIHVALAWGCAALFAGSAWAVNDRQPRSTMGTQMLLPACVTQWQDAQHHLTITEDGDGRHLLATDPTGQLLYDGRIDSDEQLRAVPRRVMRKVDRLDRLPGVQLFRHHADYGGVEVAFDPRDLPPLTEADDAELAISATQYLIDEGLLSIGDRRPVRQWREVTVNKLVCQRTETRQRLEITVPIERLVYVAAETW